MYKSSSSPRFFFALFISLPNEKTLFLYTSPVHHQGEPRQPWTACFPPNSQIHEGHVKVCLEDQGVQLSFLNLLHELLLLVVELHLFLVLLRRLAPIGFFPGLPERTCNLVEWVHYHVSSDLLDSYGDVHPLNNKKNINLVTLSLSTVLWIRKTAFCNYGTVCSSVPDPDLDPPDPHVFGPSGSGFETISQRYGSGSFYQASKNRKKNLDYYCFVTSFRLFIDEKLGKCTFKK